MPALPGGLAGGGRRAAETRADAGLRRVARGAPARGDQQAGDHGGAGFVYAGGAPEPVVRPRRGMRGGYRRRRGTPARPASPDYLAFARTSNGLSPVAPSSPRLLQIDEIDYLRHVADPQLFDIYKGYAGDDMPAAIESCILVSDRDAEE